MAEVRIKDIDDHEIDTILADDIDFEGQLTFKKPLMIRGKFKGEIRSESALYVGEKAVVEAKVESSLVSSKGRIKGDITGHSRVELAGTANVDGDITTPDFVVESGCKFNGHCNMSGQKKPGQPHPQGQPQGRQEQHGQQQGQRPQGQQPPQAQPNQEGPQHGQQPPQGQPNQQSPQHAQQQGQRPPNQQNPQQGGSH
jgi:cytoskeletal protein CcmA (bactofilin family)